MCVCVFDKDFRHVTLGYIDGNNILKDMEMIQCTASYDEGIR